MHPWQHAESFLGFSAVLSVDLNTILEWSTLTNLFVDSAVAFLTDSVLKALGVDCNTWSTDCIDGDELVLIVNEYIETTIKNPIIKDY